MEIVLWKRWVLGVRHGSVDAYTHDATILCTHLTRKKRERKTHNCSQVKECRRRSVEYVSN